MANHYSKEQIKAAKKIIDFRMDEISALHYALVYLKPEHIWACRVYKNDEPDSELYLKCLNWLQVEKAALAILRDKPFVDYFRWGDFDEVELDEADRFTRQTAGIAGMIADGLNNSVHNKAIDRICVGVVKKPYKLPRGY